MLDPKKIILTQIFEGGGGGVEVEPLSVTENGTYTADEGKAYSPVSVNVPSLTAEALSVTENGTYTAPTGKAYSPVTVDVPTGGGGGNIVTGTFTLTTTGDATLVNIPYSGSGYPVFTAIYVKYPETGSFASLVGPYHIAELVVNKINSSTPNYSSTSGNANRAREMWRYKSSTSYSTVYAVNLKSANAGEYIYSSLSADSTLPMRFSSANKMSIYCTNSDGVYGFAPNIEYEYIVVYSS